MENKANKKYRYWLHRLPEVGDRTIEKLLTAAGTPERLYTALPEVLGQVMPKKEQVDKILRFTAKWDLEEEYEKLEKDGIFFYTAEDAEYQSRIRSLVHPPYGIYCLGKMPPADKPSVAIIGARECSAYGVYMAEAFGRAMAQAGVPVISGMARGIDGISQQAALGAKGKTWAVLGCGVDVCYPACNRKLYDNILDTGGGILSVVPPGTEPMKRLFPERNRIVAGLSDLLLVIEARQKSGTWITVDMALEQGKSVYAIPGRLTDRLSDGCNMLLRQGAGIALSPEDLLTELAVMWNRRGDSREHPHKKGHTVSGGLLLEEDHTVKGELLPEEGSTIKGRVLLREEKITHGILKYLDFEPRTADEILMQIQAEGEEKTMPEVLNELVEACLEGGARQVAGNCFVRGGNKIF